MRAGMRATRPLPLHFLEGRRPRRPDARGHEGNEAVAPPFFWRAAGLGGLMRAGMRATRPLPLHVSVSVSGSQSQSSWRAAGLGGLMRAGEKGSEAAAPLIVCH